MNESTIRPSAHYRGQIAALTRSRAATDPDLLDARRRHRAALLIEQARRVLAEDPPLTPDEIAQVAAVFRGGAVA